MKKRLLSVSSCTFYLLLLSAIFCISSHAKSDNQSLDQIVAIVNDDVVTKTELHRALTAVKMQIQHEHLPAPSENVLQKQVMDQLINKKLQLQIAQRAGMRISDVELNKAIAHVAQLNHISVNSLYQRINQEGLSTSEYRHEIRDQLTLQKLQQQEVAGKIIISPQEISRFMNSKPWQNNGPKEYHLEDILVPLSDTPSQDEIAAAKKHAETIIAKLNRGQRFHEIAESESREKHPLQDHPLQYNDLGWRKLTEIPSAFTEQVSQMQVKKIVGPIQTPNGVHILRLNAVHDLSSKQAGPSRKQVEEFLLQQKFEEAVRNWVSKLRSQAFITTNPEK